MFSLTLTAYEGQCFCSFYCPESSNCFPVKTHVFERSFIFYTSVCKAWGFILRPHVVALPVSGTMSWPAKSIWKLNSSKRDFLALVSQSSNSFDMKAFFQVLFSLILAVYKGDLRLMAFGSWCPTGVFSKIENIVSILFFRLEFSNCFPVETHVFGRFFYFLYFFCNDGALMLHLHVVTLPVSVILSWPAKTTWKLNISGLDFLALLLQSSNNFDLKDFYQVLFRLNLTVYEGLVQWTPSGSLSSTGFLWKVENTVSVLFIVWSLQTVFPLKPMISECPSFFVLFVCNDEALNLRLHVVFLPASLILSWPAKTT